MNYIFKVIDKKSKKSLGFIRDSFMNLTADPNSALVFTPDSKRALELKLSKFSTRLNLVLSTDDNDEQTPSTKILKSIKNQYYYNYIPGSLDVKTQLF